MKQTAVKLLFEEFKALSKSMRDAGDVSSANLIDFLCEREEQALEMEKQQIVDAHIFSHLHYGGGMIMPSEKEFEEFANEYYEQTYGGKNE